ncbi:hypothetical protein [Luteimonas deserti]|uniref:Uncharacterized protein n=1 Tax=Luteimonas deserti TaxID=2752306 RepID=A0A7Z0TVU2_9GAMM|nr:hypothetical protein [Luteimonas deserti]NYZ62614.1 hypothetical protein [Luteimonas deserti]
MQTAPADPAALPAAPADPPAPDTLQTAVLQFLYRESNFDYHYDELLAADGTILRLLMTAHAPEPATGAMLTARWQAQTFEEAGDGSRFDAYALVDYTPSAVAPYAVHADFDAVRAHVESVPELRAPGAAAIRVQAVPHDGCGADARCELPDPPFALVELLDADGQSVRARLRVRTLPLRIETVQLGEGEPVPFTIWRERRGHLSR